MDGEAVPVEILHTRGCGNWQAALDAVCRVAEELGVVVTVRDILVESEKTARTLRFPGSPTVRVGGRDVEQGAEGRSDYGLG